MSRSWIDPATILAPGKAAKLLSEIAADKTAVLPSQAPGLAVQNAPVAPAADVGQGARGSAPPPQIGVPPPPAAPVSPAAPKPIQFQQVPRMTELPGQEPSLAARARPDLPTAAERHQGFVGSYSDPQAMNKSLRQHGKGSLNVVFHGQLANGGGYIAKPHEGIGHRDRFRPDEAQRMNDETFQSLKNDAPANAERHNATYDLMSAMGAHHMVAPGMQANMHGAHQFKGASPDEMDTDEKRLTMAKHHAGGLAHVQEFIPDTTPVNQASPEQLNQVDSEHRLHGLVSHLLMGNGDAHSANVLLHKSGHPVLIDHDITLGSSQAQAYKEHFGKPSIRSVFAPGGALDYQAKMPKDANGQPMPVGTNYPPRMAEVLNRAAEGYYSKGPGALNLSPQDHAVLQQNARDLLSHGLEGTLSRRHDIDAEQRAKKAEKVARLKK